MARNTNLHSAKRAKQDEFYTQLVDIEKEMNGYLDYNPDVFKDKTILLPCDDPEWSNFTKFFESRFKDYGIKKIISTSYSGDGGRGKISIFDGVGDGEWSYLDGDGDFRSDEVTALRDEADIVITNPPFSLFRDFMGWLIDGDVLFSIIGNMNAVTYKEIFPLIKSNVIWPGTSFDKTMEFAVPNDYYAKDDAEVDRRGNRIVKGPAIAWYTNIEHGRRNEPLELLTMADNLKYSRRKKIREEGYPKYDNYDAIEVGFTEAIPSDYDGVMGVPISFLSKYNPEQFEIIKFRHGDDGKDLRVNGKTPYFRILIRHKRR